MAGHNDLAQRGSADIRLKRYAFDYELPHMACAPARLAGHLLVQNRFSNLLPLWLPNSHAINRNIQLFHMIAY